MRITQYQSNFSSGVLDPLLRGRTDLQQYQNGLEEAVNVVVQPQGGVKRRDGLEFISSAASSFSDYKLIPFEFSVSDTYLLVIVTGRIYVYKDDTLQADINGTGNSFIAASDITAAMLDELEYTQAVDTLILCHEDLQTKRLVRNSDTSWTFENLPLTNTPQYAYALDEHSPNFDITPSATSGNITITASNVTTDTGTAQAGGASTITLKSSTNYSSDDAPNGMWVTLTSGTGSGQERYISDYVASTKVATVYPAWTTQPDATTGYKVEAFAASAVGNYAQVTNTFGRVKYIEFSSLTVMKALVEVPFFDTSSVAAGNWIGEFGYEDVWSNARGWPRSATFHEGRLYFGGSKSRPNTVWGSRVIDYFNFGAGTGLADESVETTINTNQLNAIVNIVSGADLRIFTTGGEFIVVQSEDNPITPSSFLVRPQTRLGSKVGVPIVDLNGATIFVQREGKAIHAFQFGSNTSSYQVQNLSLLSSHLLIDPVDMDVRRASSTDEADRLFVVNSDGTMVVYSILTGQNVIAASKFTTNGDFIAVTVEGSTVYCIVKRIIRDGTNIPTVSYSLEKFNSAATTDSCVRRDDAAAFPGGAAHTGSLAGSIAMGNFNGLPVKVITDNVPAANQTAPFSGALYVTFASTAFRMYEVGLEYTVSVKTMPAEPTLSSGSIHGMKKRIVQVDALLDKTRDLKINGKAISFSTSTALSDDDDALFTNKTNLSAGKLTLDGTLGNDNTTADLGSTARIITFEYSSITVSGQSIIINGVDENDLPESETITTTSSDDYATSTKFKTINFINQPITSSSVTLKVGVASEPSSIAEYTGLKTAHGLLGYANSGQITLTQTDPLPMTVLGLEYKLSTGS